MRLRVHFLSYFHRLKSPKAGEPIGTMQPCAEGRRVAKSWIANKMYRAR